MMRLKGCVLAAAFWCATQASHSAQVPASGPTGSLRFDTVAIHPSRPGESGFIKPLAGGHGYTVVNIPVKLMISLMYRVPMRQIEGGPEWMNSDRYDIEARADGVYNVDDLHIMFQNLLAGRFGLKFHKDARPGNVYALTVDKGGSKLQVNGSDDKYDIPINGAPENVTGRRVGMAYFCWWLGQQLQRDERPVVDETGLDRFYDFKMSFAPVLPADADTSNLPPGIMDHPSIFDALRDQLGLKLTPQKGTVLYYVIDRVEKPSEN